MDVKKSPWPVATAFGVRTKIDTNPDFQRPAVWTRSQKQLLVDTVLRGYDVPKFYWRKTGSKPDTYEVVDGQQRLRALWEFQAGGFRLAKGMEPIDGEDVTDLRYVDLPDELRIRFDTYSLDVVILTNTDEDEVREMFLRLQNGTSLKAQERRNAMSGKMRDFVKSLATHPFFERCAFTNSRYNFDLVASQMTLTELSGGPCNVKNGHLNKMYEQYEQFDASGAKAKKIRRVIDYLAKAFPEKTPELERFSVLSLFILVSSMLERYVISDRASEIANWFIDFEGRRRLQAHLPEETPDPEFITYRRVTSSGTDTVESLTWRHEFLLRDLLSSIQDIEQRDDQRLFTKEQRIAIFRRDHGLCQVRLKCQGNQCKWEDWEADHIHAWTKGGKTTVANGQVACLACNPSKGGN